MRVLLLTALVLGGVLLGGCSRDDNPKVETVTGTQAQETLKNMRKPASMGGQQGAGANSTQ